MMFILSKVLLLLLFPITWVFVIFIFAIIIKKTRRKQTLLLAGTILLYISSTPVLLDSYARVWDYQPVHLPANQTYSCAIILGGFSSEKYDSTGYFNGAADRFIQAVELKSTRKASHLLISGGNGMLNGDGFKEADWVKGQLKQFNIPDTSVLIENQSRNTIENAAYTKKLLISRHLAPPYLLVTSAFHMRRSMLIFKKSGMDVTAYPCNYTAGVGKLDLKSFLPSSYVFSTWEIYTKEAVGIIVAWLHHY